LFVRLYFDRHIMARLAIDLLRLPEALTIVETFLATADGRLAGAEEVRSAPP